MNCEKRPITIYKGFGTRWDGIDLITVTFDSEIDIEGFSAQFIIGDVEKTYTNIENGFAINLIASEAESLPLGALTGTLIIIDKENNKKPFSTEIPFMVKDWEDGNIKLDGFKVFINSIVQDNKLEVALNVGDSGLHSIKGFDASKVQILKNVNGNIEWVDNF